MANTRGSLPDISVTRAAIALLPRLKGGMLAALVAVTIGTNLIDFVTLPAEGQRSETAFALAAALRILLVFWAGFVVQRRMVDARAGFGIDGGFWRFAFLQVLLLIGMVALRAVLLRLMPPAPGLAGEWLANFLSLAAWSIVTIRLLAWNAALAAGAPLRDLGHVFHGQRGQDAGLLSALAMLVLPATALHLAFTLIGVRVHMAPAPLAFLGLVDGLVSAAQIALGCAIGAVALRLASRPEAR